MLRSNMIMASIAAAMVSFGLDGTTASAQTTYQFSANYDTVSQDIPTDTPGVIKILLQGGSSDAPYGLTRASSVSYAQINPVTGAGIINTDPTVFGAQNLPQGFFTVFGSGSNKLFGTVSGTSSLDLPTLTNTLSGILSITGGEGIFSGATGALTLSAIETFNPDFTGARGRFSVNGVIVSDASTAVPEPTSALSILALGAVGAASLLKRNKS